MERRLLAVNGYLEQRVDAASHDPRSDERHQRVDAIDDERPRPAADLVHVENPEARRQHDTREPGGEDDIARRPEILIDGKNPAPQLAGDHAEAAGAVETGD